MSTAAAAEEIEGFFAGGAKSAKFPDGAIGTVIGGEIVEEPELRQQRDYDTDELVFYADGKPAMQMVIVVQAQEPDGDDDGRRAFYARGQLKAAIGDALRKTGERVPRRGGQLWVKLTGEEPVQLRNGKPGKPKKIHAAKYTPPAQQAAGQFFTEAPENTTPATRAAAPAGIDPRAWAAMSEGQRQQMRDALENATTLNGGTAGRGFTDEPPF